MRARRKDFVVCFFFLQTFPLFIYLFIFCYFIVGEGRHLSFFLVLYMYSLLKYISLTEII